MDLTFLVAFVLLGALTWWRSGSVAWTVVMVTASVSLVGAVVGFVIDHVTLWSRVPLQGMLLLALLIPATLAFIRKPVADSPRRIQLLAIALLVALLIVFFAVMTTWWTETPAFLAPVNFLMGHALAEDNAKWLDFTSVLASGGAISQSVPMGGPLQLILVFVATFMGVISQIVLGGYNEVFVAANTVVYGQFALVAIAPLALAPLVGQRLQSPTIDERSRQIRVPWALIWLGALVLVIANLMLTAYGHLTLQYTILVCSLWVTTFLIWSSVPRALLLTSMSVAIGMTVWLPMNAIAGVLIVGWFAYLLGRAIRGGRQALDLVGLSIVALVAVCIWEPMRSSISFVLASAPNAAEPLVLGGGGVRAVAAFGGERLTQVLAGLTDSTLFAAGGGTERTTPLLAGIAAVSLVAAAVVISRQGVGRQAYARFVPVVLLSGFAMLLNVMDQWATGSAPNYGSLKFTFMVIIVLMGACLPVGMLLLDPRASGMTLARWIGVGAVLLLLSVDSLLVRSVAAARPEQWSPPIPFDNPRSFWWPADVDGAPKQSITDNPIGCVYLPAGAKAPSGILDSKLSDPQRVYSCTRLLAGLAGEDAGAQPMVDWLRREWLTNTRAWEGVHGYLAAMPDSVLDRPVILLDDGSNVIGLESMRSLLARFPATAWSEP